VSLVSIDVVNVKKAGHRPQKGLTESRYASSHEASMIESHKWPLEVSDRSVVS